MGKVRRGVVVREKVDDEMAPSVMKRLRHVEHMSEEPLSKRAYKSDVESVGDFARGY